MLANSESQKEKILIISDEPNTAEVWGFSLKQVGLNVRLLDVTNDILAAFDREYPDLIIIEDFNEEVEELEICRQLREITAVPILYLTTKNSENFQLTVYEMGADECIIQPITPRVFQYKVNAWLRRTKNLPLASLDEVRAEGFTLDPDSKKLTLPDGEVVYLTMLETRLLYLLMSHQGSSMHKSEIIERVWGNFTGIDSRLLKNHIYRLRRKIEPDPSRPRILVNAGYSGYGFMPDRNGPATGDGGGR
jgi:DNA-binding response OmpR family regulator